MTFIFFRRGLVNHQPVMNTWDHLDLPQWPPTYVGNAARCRDKLLTYERSTEASTADYKVRSRGVEMGWWFFLGSRSGISPWNIRVFCYMGMYIIIYIYDYMILYIYIWLYDIIHTYTYVYIYIYAYLTNEWWLV